jgi:tetratricopeptide (TPR) repeat protein
LREQKLQLEQQQTMLADRMQQLQSERGDLTNQLASLVMENAYLKSNPHELELIKLRGEIGVLHNRLVDAETTTSKSEQPPLSSALEYLKRADRHASEHKYEAELDDLNKAIELDPNLADADTKRAALYASNLPRSCGGYTNAIADYTRYFELKPREAPFWHNRGYYYEQLREYDKAISDYSMVIEGDLDFSRQDDGKNKLIATDYFYRGRIYQWHKHDYTKAGADYTAALQLNPQIEGVHRNRGESYELLGETEKAQQDF